MEGWEVTAEMKLLTEDAVEKGEKGGRTTMETERPWETRSLANSVMGARWPTPLDGKSTTVLSMDGGCRDAEALICFSFSEITVSKL